MTEEHGAILRDIARYSLTDEYRRKAAIISELVRDCHDASVAAGWYTDPETGQPKQRNVGEMLCLIHSEISEAMEAYRKDQKDDHLPNHPGITVELADALIRIFDLAGYLKLHLEEAYAEKRRYNELRLDHKIEARKAVGGKSF